MSASPSDTMPGPIITIPGPQNLAIRPLHLTDAPSFARNANNRNVWISLSNKMPHPYTEADGRNWVTFATDTSKWQASGPWSPEIGATGPLLPFSYAVTIDGEAVGNVTLMFNNPADIYARCATLGYWLGEPYWGRGVMGKLVPKFVEWAWGTWGVLIRMNSSALAENTRSRRVLEHAGIVHEGTREKAAVKDGQVKDEVFVGALRPE